MDIKKGDIVKLKSGGPVMTVQEIGTFGMVGQEGALCVWFDNKESKEKVFDFATLEKHDPNAHREVNVITRRSGSQRR